MCGRYTLTQEEMEFASRFGNGVLHGRVTPRYNIAPSQRVPVLVVDKQGLVQKEMRWGWTPAWVVYLRRRKSCWVPMVSSCTE